MKSLAIIYLSQIDRGDVPGIPDADPNAVQNALQIAFGIAAGIAIIMIAISALTYVTSGGSPDKIKRAKDTIMYSLIGLVVALSAFAIVTWVVGQV